MPTIGRFPQALRRSMVEAGAEEPHTTGEAEEQQTPGEALYWLRIDGTTSPAWSLYRDWACSLGDADPNVIAFFAPSSAIAGTVLMPALATVGPLLREVNSIMVHYATLDTEHLEAAIPPPLPAPKGLIAFPDASVAVIALIEGIQNPPANYPVLSSIRSGSYICDLFYQWMMQASPSLSLNLKDSCSL